MSAPVINNERKIIEILSPTNKGLQTAHKPFSVPSMPPFPVQLGSQTPEALKKLLKAKEKSNSQNSHHLGHLWDKALLLL